MKKLQKASLIRNSENHNARVIAFTIAKGGQLKTTSVVNLAGAIMKDNLLKEAKVCIIDVDPQAHVLKSFGYNAQQLNDKQNYGAALIGYINEDGERLHSWGVIEDCIFEIYRENEHKFIHAISSNELCDFLDVNILLDNNLNKQPTLLLNQLIEQLKGYYDYIFIDTPPSYSVMITNVLMVSDVEIYIPYEPDAYSVESAAKSIRVCKSLINEGNPSLQLKGLIATKVKKNTNVHAQLIEYAQQLASTQDVRHFKTNIPNTIKTSGAILYETLPSTLSPKAGDRVREYIYLWREIKE